jgi:hypothetical protein
VEKGVSRLAAESKTLDASVAKETAQDQIALQDASEIVIEEETAYATMLVQYDIDC